MRNKKSYHTSNYVQPTNELHYILGINSLSSSSKLSLSLWEWMLELCGGNEVKANRILPIIAECIDGYGGAD